MMITHGEDMQVHALRKQGWSISAIARHLGRDRKTIRDYLSGKRIPQKRATSKEPQFNTYEEFIKSRLEDDKHLWASTLYFEVVELGYTQCYSTFTHYLRLRVLRPHCEHCSGSKGRQTIEIPHPNGEEIQWDWNDEEKWSLGRYGLRAARGLALFR